MTRFRDVPEADALGQALAVLRKARGLSQAEAGARMGVTSQAWGLYEAGRRPGMFRPDVQRRLTAALDLTPEDLALEMARRPVFAAPAPERLEERGRTFSAANSPAPLRRTLQLRDDDLAPWAGSGVVLIYDLSVWPRRDQGCVVETDDGPVIGLYHRGDRDTVVLRGPDGDKRVLERRRIGAVGAVVARLEGVEWPE
ncbi:helix-turn-helix transcriptional regulator [Brevundimonas sp.]|uniref:helix-turn-helix transcriptional regulator n=1 Tax=Brevundimonas sp. TaxID=1871086 RepID=UPI00391B6A6A